jgi:hypothetical protein
MAATEIEETTRLPKVKDTDSFPLWDFEIKILMRAKDVVPHPSHLPDLAPRDFSLFPQLKMKLKGHHFDTIEVTEAEM